MNKKSPFYKFLTTFGFVDFNTPDLPGDLGAGSGSDDGNLDDQNERSGGADNDSNTGNGDAGGDTGEDTGTGDASKSAATTPDYDSRFNALDTRIGDLLSAITKTNSGNDGGGNTTQLEHEDLVAMMAEDPAGFISKITAEVEKSVTAKVTADNATSAYNAKIETTINKYADTNPDFEKMWDDGKIQEFMESNPGHNAISAHMAMTMEQRIKDAEKAGADKAVRNFRTKSNNQVLSNGPGISPEQRDAALKNPEKFGGRSAVLALRAGIQ